MAGGRGRIADYNATLTPEQRKQAAIKAAKAGGQKMKEKKALKELARTILNMKLKPGQLDELNETGSISELGKSNMDVRTGLILAAVKRGLAGDIKAQEMLFTLTGEKVDKQELQLKSETPLSQTLIYLPDNGRGKAKK